MKTRNRRSVGIMVMALAVFGFLGQANVFAHCDTLDGPVVVEARAALESGDVTPVLKWVRPSDEDAIKAVFKQALEVRTKGEQAKNLADNYFFETLVRIHRAGEGQPYSGLKPAGTLEPAIAAADKSIEEGSVDELAQHVASAASQAIKTRYEALKKAQQKKDESVEAGRKYVEAYVQYIHFVEGIHNMVAGQGTHEHAPAVNHEVSAEQHQH